MKIILKNGFVEQFNLAHAKSHPLLTVWMKEKISRYGEQTLTLNTTKLEDFDEGLTPEGLEDLLYEFARQVKNQGVMMFIGSIRLALKDVKRAKPGSLPALQAALIEYLKEGAVDGWLYSKNPGDEKFLPFVVNRVHLRLATAREKEDGHKDYVRLSYTANSTAKTVHSYSDRRRNEDGSEYDSVMWEWGGFNKKTVPELLLEKGLFHETRELKEDYERQLTLYREYRPRFGQQFVGATGSYEREATEDRYERGGARFLGEAAKYINDEESVKRGEMAEERDNTWWLTDGRCKDEELFRRLPVHPYLRMFNLETHRFAFMHVDALKPYVFDATLRDKIVLPETHRDLIEVLVEDLDAVRGDVVAGKSGGTNILCQGGPGLGKTLTAEIYSEVSEKPLYRVHSGQLGTDPKQVEENLKVIFARAEKWRCILLLDEADVYIRRRGDDLEHNAVVACFLRTMEYFGGVFFMTTNRQNDVDDAIVSRCIALITYETPGTADLARIFRIQSDAWGSDLSDEDIEKLTGFYAGKISGRDVKELLKLATRYAQSKGTRVNSETVRKLAQFKGF